MSTGTPGRKLGWRLRGVRRLAFGGSTRLTFLGSRQAAGTRQTTLSQVFAGGGGTTKQLAIHTHFY